MTETSSEDRPVALVTGATRGIGRATAEALAAAGYRLFICSRSEQQAVEAAAEISVAFGTEVRGVGADLADPLVGQQLVGLCMERFGRIDCLVNNAGIFEPTPLDGLTAEAWDKTLNANLRGPALLSAAAAQVMRDHSGCSIINLTSINGLASEADFSAYNSSKSGIIMLTKTLAIELAARGIRANAVAPGWILTSMSEDYVASLPQEHIDRLVPMRRLGVPEDISGVIAFLASDAARYVTGQTITVDGGMLVPQPAI